ncbi:MAG: hypothetical protein ACR2NO_06915 [Chloroflexota bacterium]
MAELDTVADQFAKDLIAQNIAGLMMTFTPVGMGKAMAMQAQMQANPRPPATGYEVRMAGEDGDDKVVEIVMKNPEGEGVIVTKWKDVAGAWKCDDMAMKA